MLALLRKEINSFLSSLIGYVVLVVFLGTIGIIAWVAPDTGFNLLDNGYANLDTLFIIAPFVFMFLIPAITMRSFAEENKTGTIELLLTRPLTDFQIIFSKYVAGLILVIFALLPTLIYFISIYYLSAPSGNVDTGSIWGSYLGLLFIGSTFVAIGIFSSSVSDNQIISFITGMLLCFVCHLGFEKLGSLSLFGKFDSTIVQLGINAHYSSISRGVADTRDVIYFLSSTIFFLLLTKFILEKRKW